MIMYSVAVPNSSIFEGGDFIADMTYKIFRLEKGKNPPHIAMSGGCRGITIRT